MACCTYVTVYFTCPPENVCNISESQAAAPVWLGGEWNLIFFAFCRALFTCRQLLTFVSNDEMFKLIWSSPPDTHSKQPDVGTNCLPWNLFMKFIIPARGLNRGGLCHSLPHFWINENMCVFNKLTNTPNQGLCQLTVVSDFWAYRRSSDVEGLWIRSVSSKSTQILVSGRNRIRVFPQINCAQGIWFLHAIQFFKSGPPIFLKKLQGMPALSQSHSNLPMSEMRQPHFFPAKCRNFCCVSVALCLKPSSMEVSGHLFCFKSALVRCGQQNYTDRDFHNYSSTKSASISF